MVIKRHLTSTRKSCWWPRTEFGEADRDAALEVNPNSIDGSHTEDNTLDLEHSQSKRRELLKRIHILGAGNLGAFVAHSLAGIPNRPNVTLLLRHRQLRAWKDYGCSIEIITRGVKEIRHEFDAEAVGRLSENSSIPAEKRSEKGEDLSKGTEIGDQETPSIDNSTSKTGHISASVRPTLEQRNNTADDSSQQDLRSGSNAIKESVSEAGESATLQMETNNWFANTDQVVDEVQHNESDIPISEQTHSFDGQDEIIYHLIVSVKAPQTVKAIQAVAHRLTHDSSILFLQNGMGVVDEVNEQLFPDEKTRPTYIVGVVSHGLYSNHPFSIVHAGEGTIALGVLPRTPLGKSIQPQALNQQSNSARYLMRTMTRTTVFVAVGFSPTDLLQQQLDKLAVNCIVNPLTAILDCKNGTLLYNFYLTRVTRLLLAEISLVIKSLPELKNVPNVKMRYDTLRLERLVSSIAKSTAENYSSMVQDIRSGRPTEIDYMNGYIIKRGEEMGVHCVVNYMLMHLVKGKNKNTSRESVDLLPLTGQMS